MIVLPALVRGHAYIFFPPMRGGTGGSPTNGYCPHCLGTTTLPMPTCGKDNFLNYADGPVTTLEAGQKVQFEIRVTAHHRGHFQFRLCDRQIDSSLGGPAGEEACLNGHVLERVRPEEMHSDCQQNDMRGDCQPFDEANPSYWYLPPATEGDTINVDLLEERASSKSSLTQAKSTVEVKSHAHRAGAIYKFHYKLPAGFTCQRCTLQWWWLTANSCTPHPDAYRCYFGSSGKMQQQGWNVSDWCKGACSYSGSCPAVQGPPVNCGEQFKNCADVRILPTTTMDPAVSTSLQPETPSTTTPSATVEPESESEEEQEEEHEEEQEENEEEEQTSIPPSSSSPAPTPAPGSGMVCTATPGLNRGVTNEACHTCTQGYQWWPCNEAALCTCTESLVGLASVPGNKRGKEHHFLGLIQQSDEVQKGAFDPHDSVMMASGASKEEL